jgi:hypothetical protein
MVQAQLQMLVQAQLQLFLRAGAASASLEFLVLL